MSAGTERLQLVADMLRAAANLAAGDADEAQRLADEAADAEQAEIAAAAAKAAAEAAEAGEATPLPVALDAQPVAFGGFGQETAAPGPVQRSPEELLAATAADPEAAS